jgi:hypothetical protein
MRLPQARGVGLSLFIVTFGHDSLFQRIENLFRTIDIESVG